MNSEYVVCALVTPLRTGDIFTAWPLHMTIIPWFSAQNITQMVKDISDAVRTHVPISTVVQEENIWGTHTVSIVARTRQIHQLHKDILSVVLLHGVVRANRRYMGEAYTPHITHQKDRALKPGDVVHLGEVYVIEKAIDSRQKRVLAKISLID